MSSVADLLADLLAPAELVRVELSPAKIANPANVKAPRGLAADFEPANPLRISANLPPPLTEAARPHRLTPEEADRCHSPCWDDAEIGAFTARWMLFLRRGIDAVDADDMAERLTLRDRELDDRRMCCECSHGRSKRCPDGAPGPVGLLQRCDYFQAVAGDGRQTT